MFGMCMLAKIMGSISMVCQKKHKVWDAHHQKAVFWSKEDVLTFPRPVRAIVFIEFILCILLPF